MLHVYILTLDLTKRETFGVVINVAQRYKLYILDHCKVYICDYVHKNIEI